MPRSPGCLFQATQKAAQNRPQACCWPTLHPRAILLGSGAAWKGDWGSRGAGPTCWLEWLAVSPVTALLRAGRPGDWLKLPRGQGQPSPGAVAPSRAQLGQATHCFWAWSMRLLRLVICKQHGQLTARSPSGAQRAWAGAPFLAAGLLGGPGGPRCHTRATRSLTVPDSWLADTVPRPSGSDLLLVVHWRPGLRHTAAPSWPLTFQPAAGCGAEGTGREARLANRAPGPGSP